MSRGKGDYSCLGAVNSNHMASRSNPTVSTIPDALFEDNRRTVEDPTPIFKPEPTGLTVGTRVGVAEIPVGIFTIKNLMVSAAVLLPFDGTPVSLEFGFAERSNPFQLTVSLFGGGGFVVSSLDTQHPVTELEAALEFGRLRHAELRRGVGSDLRQGRDLHLLQRPPS